MTTQEIIESLRELAAMPDYAPIREMRAAADKLEELQRLNDSMQTDRDLWIKVGREKLEAVEKERDQARVEVEQLKAELHDTIESYKLNNLQPKAIRPEPSRLEIAAMLYASGIVAGRIAIDFDPDIMGTNEVMTHTDALIAAAKEAKC